MSESSHLGLPHPAQRLGRRHGLLAGKQLRRERRSGAAALHRHADAVQLAFLEADVDAVARLVLAQAEVDAAAVTAAAAGAGAAASGAVAGGPSTMTAPQASRGGGAIKISNAPSGVPPRMRALVVWKPPQPRCTVPLEPRALSRI